MPALTLSPSTVTKQASCVTSPSPLTPPPDKGNYFAFARVKGEVRLVQISGATPVSPFLPVDANVFRHEFITIFRFVESATLHPSDFSIIECLDDSCLRYEEENGTVFLAKDLMERLRQLTADPRKMAIQNRRYSLQRYRLR